MVECTAFISYSDYNIKREYSAAAGILQAGAGTAEQAD
jgi:hypothetical protein